MALCCSPDLHYTCKWFSSTWRENMLSSLNTEHFDPWRVVRWGNLPTLATSDSQSSVLTHLEPNLLSSVQMSFGLLLLSILIIVCTMWMFINLSLDVGMFVWILCHHWCITFSNLSSSSNWAKRVSDLLAF